MTRLVVGDIVEITAEGVPQWYRGTVSGLDGEYGFFVSSFDCGVKNLWRAWDTEGVYWRRSPRDGRCQRDLTYHDRIRSDSALFDAEAIKIGRQECVGMALDLGLCPGCGTTVSKRVEDIDPAAAAVLRYDVCRIARIDARGWKARNKQVTPNEQVIKNHYSMSRERGYLGSVSRAPQGVAWEEYKAEFLSEAAK